MAARDMLERIEGEVSNKLGDEPRLRAEMLEDLGAVSRNLGLYEDAAVLMAESLRISREIFPRSASSTKRLLNVECSVLKPVSGNSTV